jgi:Protein of unknown function (DUF2946)
VDDWVERAMRRWPNVPALFGWLGLDRRGRWLIRDEVIRHLRIIHTISRNYAGDAHGRWFFQNGPQRGFIRLASTPMILKTTGDETLITHTELRVEHATSAFLTDEASIVLSTEHGPGEIVGADLDWALQRLRRADENVTEEALADALTLPSGELTHLSLAGDGFNLPLTRLDFAGAPARLNFVRDAQPRDGERAATGAPD